MTIDYSMLGHRIANARKNLGLSQEALGEIIHVSAKRMGNIEMGKSRLTIAMLVAISNALHISPDELLADSLPRSLYTEETWPHQLPADCNEERE